MGSPCWSRLLAGPLDLQEAGIVLNLNHNHAYHESERNNIMLTENWLKDHKQEDQSSGLQFWFDPHFQGFLNPDFIFENPEAYVCLLAAR
ncbi:hypothetical protein WISP_104151 [Willisornis vidua]|uniref:Uncharacterized protein n=1 Tax=Willisornis vidua TaxID=1566151 RepID=A0ABQ9CXI5_9PASS|nr:hypothetical protein WISP_104151 [Willisornis vidua]